jgi:5-methylcytosine-specific restriction endonuclease McrA
MKITPEVWAKCELMPNGKYRYKITPNVRYPLYLWLRPECKTCHKPFLATKKGDTENGDPILTDYCDRSCARNKEYTAEERQRLGDANRGKVRSPEFRAHASETLRGRKMLPQVRAAIFSPESRAKGRVASAAAIARGEGKHAKPDSASAKYRVFKEYVQGAKERNLVFELTEEEFMALVVQPCHYCGSPPSNVKPSRAARSPEAFFVHGGVDRVDPYKGYTVDNVVPCCTECNIGKKRLTGDEFIAWAHKVVEFNPDGTRCLIQVGDPSANKAVTTALFHKCKDSGSLKRRHLPFDLSKGQYRYLIRCQCSYCGEPPFARYHISTESSPFLEVVYTGIDRKDVNQGYVDTNVVPCCKICNYAKGVKSVEEFYTWVNRIVAFQDSLANTKVA